MLITFRNLIVNILASFIRNSEQRHRFRNKYKIRSRFRKLRDDNRILFNENKRIRSDILALKSELLSMKENYGQQLRDIEIERSLTFRVTPLDLSQSLAPKGDVFLSIVCIAKNEGPYLREWIEYHKIVGVDRFYFYDNESDDNTKIILDPYIKDGTVVYHYVPNHPITKQSPQIESYNDAIFKYRDKTKWMAIIDIDEFIVPVEKNSIPEFLVDYDQYAAVAVNWLCFDSSGHNKIPTEHGGLLSANYTRVRKEKNKLIDRTVKPIFNPKRVVKCISPHYCLYYLGGRAVSENFIRVQGPSSQVHSSKKIRINHYYTKSRDEYINKLKRNHKGNIAVYKYNEDFVNFQDETTDDLVIQKFLPTLKLALGIKE